jgi:type I restriction enzyme, S subunit
MEKQINTPKLRFPEFEGEWIFTKLGEVGQIVTGKTPSTKEESLWNGEVLFVTPTDIVGEKFQTITQRTIKNKRILNCSQQKV